MTKIFEFEIVIGGIAVQTDDQLFEISDKLFDAGCSDATIVSENDTVVACFSREAESLELAIKSAKNDIDSVDGVFSASVLTEKKYSI